MQFANPLISGRLLRRYKRFLADIELDDGQVVTAHCANPGAMTGLNAPGLRVWLSPATNPKRKLRYSWELVEIGAGLVGINTAHPNRIVEEGILDGSIPELSGYDQLRREVKYGRNSRIDLLLETPDRQDCYVEVKNVHLMREGGLAEFPDSVTARGAKHLHELGDMVAAGQRSVMVYLVQRDDCDRFTIAGDIDPAYLKALMEAQQRGVELLCYRCRLSVSGITVNESLPIVI